MVRRITPSLSFPLLGRRSFHPFRFPDPNRPHLISVSFQEPTDHVGGAHCFYQAQPMTALSLSPVTATNLIKNLCRQSSFALARRLFDEMPHRDVVSWTAMISGYASNGCHEDALATFCRMIASRVCPNRYTISSVLTSCRGLQSSCAGVAVHGMAVRWGIDNGAYVENALLDLYASFGCIGDAEAVFKNMTDRTVVSWTTMIAGYTRISHGDTGLLLFKQMIQQECTELNAFTCSIAIHACSSIGCATTGQQLHALALKTRHDSSLPVSNSLLNMYSRCMNISEAKKFFHEMPRKDLITWNAMIASLERSNSHEALLLFLEMGSQNMQPTSFTFSSVVAACANMAILNCGRQVHGAAIRRGHQRNLQVANALIDMYAKCGSIGNSRKVFDEITEKDLVTWTSLVIGCGMNGYGAEATEIFDEMISSGVQPDQVLLMSVISACSHAGLVDQGLRYFSLMNIEYNVPPNREIYGCVVDLLGRAGRITEAYQLIETMPFEPDETIWGALLGACKMHKNVYLGRLAAQKIFDMRPNESKTYVLLSNIYAAGRAWGDFAEMRRCLREQGNKKEAGMSWIEVRDEVRGFASGDRSSSPHIVLVYQTLEELIQHMNQDGCESDSHWVLHDFSGVT
ncbi:putative pentatricopeptide repeat-containing protein At1g56570 isoform X1 [Musa acuminata AAA Group]|uniref:putative pentatricopeptide repeat-containing protein At1g56570 isoform X1 n=1 Tax=Musa acuminata AAA Group TaxID=214697 RepID=UPI0031DB0470